MNHLPLAVNMRVLAAGGKYKTGTIIAMVKKQEGEDNPPYVRVRWDGFWERTRWVSAWDVYPLEELFK